MYWSVSSGFADMGSEFIFDNNNPTTTTAGIPITLRTLNSNSSTSTSWWDTLGGHDTNIINEWSYILPLQCCILD